MTIRDGEAGRGLQPVAGLAAWWGWRRAVTWSGLRYDWHPCPGGGPGLDLMLVMRRQGQGRHQPGSPEVKDVRIVGIAGLGQKAGGGPRVASARRAGRIQVVKAGDEEGFRGPRIRVAGWGACLAVISAGSATQVRRNG
jgi:hypothetical protein